MTGAQCALRGYTRALVRRVRCITFDVDDAVRLAFVSRTPASSTLGLGEVGVMMIMLLILLIGVSA